MIEEDHICPYCHYAVVFPSVHYIDNKCDLYQNEIIFLGPIRNKEDEIKRRTEEIVKISLRRRYN